MKKKHKKHTRYTGRLKQPKHKRYDLLDNFRTWSGGFRPESEDQIVVYLDYALPIPVGSFHGAVPDREFARVLLEEWMNRLDRCNDDRFLVVCLIRDIIDRRGDGAIREIASQRLADEMQDYNRYELVEAYVLLAEVGCVGYNRMSKNALAEELADADFSEDNWDEEDGGEYSLVKAVEYIYGS